MEVEIEAILDIWLSSVMGSVKLGTALSRDAVDIVVFDTKPSYTASATTTIPSYLIDWDPSLWSSGLNFETKLLTSEIKSLINVLTYDLSLDALVSAS